MKKQKYASYQDVKTDNLKKSEKVYCTDKVEERYWSVGDLCKKLQSYPEDSSISFEKEYMYYDDYQILMEINYYRPETDEEFELRKVEYQKQVYNVYKAKQAKAEALKQAKQSEKDKFIQLASKYGIELPETF